MSEEEAPLPSEAAVRHWLQYGRPPGSKVGGAQQVSFSVFERPSYLDSLHNALHSGTAWHGTSC